MYHNRNKPKEQGRTPQPPNPKKILFDPLISGTNTTVKHLNKGNIYKIDRIRHEKKKNDNLY